jgi:SAM-dependent methyltransferase
MANILDFGTDNNGMKNADWVEGDALSDTTPFGKVIHNYWINPGNPIRNKCQYDLIKCNFALATNQFNNWEFLLNEMKRVLSHDGMISIIDVVNTDEELNEANVRKLFHQVFPAGEWVVMLNTNTIDNGSNVEVWANIQRFVD